MLSARSSESGRLRRTRSRRFRTSTLLEPASGVPPRWFSRSSPPFCRDTPRLRSLLASDNRVALDLDLRVGVGQRRYRNQRAAREVVAEDLSTDFRETI